MGPLDRVTALRRYHRAPRAPEIPQPSCFFGFSSPRFLSAKAAATVILVCLGCCDKVPQIEWLINMRNLFLIVLEAASSRSGPARSGYGKDPLLLQMAVFSQCPHVVEGSSLGSLYKNTNLTHEGSTLIT